LRELEAELAGEESEWYELIRSSNDKEGTNINAVKPLRGPEKIGKQWLD